MAADAVGAGVQYPRKGPNKAAVPQEKAARAGNVGTPVGTGDAKAVPGAEELLALFRSLDPSARADLLAVARGLAAPKSKVGDARNR